MDFPEYIFCQWQSRFWPAKVLSKRRRITKNSKLNVEILVANEQITVKFMDTKPFLSTELDTIMNLKDIMKDCNETIEEQTYRRALREAHDLILNISSSQASPGLKEFKSSGLISKQKEDTDSNALTFRVRRYRPLAHTSTITTDELSIPTKRQESTTEDKPVLSKHKHMHHYFDPDDEQPTASSSLPTSNIPADQQHFDKIETSCVKSPPENNKSEKVTVKRRRHVAKTLKSQSAITESQAESSNTNTKGLNIHTNMQTLMPEDDTALSSSELSMEISSPEQSSLHFTSTHYDTEEDMQLPVIAFQQEPLSFIPGAFVWCKYKRFPYWPAWIKAVHKKQKKATLMFLEPSLMDPDEKKKSFTVALHNLEHYDCPEKQQLLEIGHNDYGKLFDWCDSLICDYRIRIGCGSFSGSFIDYCTAAISLPLRRQYESGTEWAHFPSTDPETPPVLPEKAHVTKKILPDRKRAARDRENEKLVACIVKAKQAENHLLDILKGKKKSKWLKKFQSSSRLVNCLETYIEDEDQLDLVVSYLQMLCKNMSSTVNQLMNGDETKFIVEVLLPEALIFAISATDKISYEKAEKKYLEGPAVSKRERKLFEQQILKRKRL